ncbi:MAG: SRPBCC domain-containing protein [Dehalococcoidia bacterium]|nr:SRPBCC domain-containing protein [Dehalococcoidia bacterium]
MHVKAKPEVVYQYLTDPAKYVLWKGRKATLEPRAGGVYRVEFNERDTVSGKFVEVMPNKKVVFTWGWETPGNPIKPGSSTVSITLAADGAGTKLTLVHTGLPEPAMAQVSANLKAHKTDAFGVTAVNLFMGSNGEAYCMTEAPNADAVKKSHDIHQVKALV